MKLHPMKYLTLVVFLFTLFSNPVHAIKKCQDSEGRWHYGDIAVVQCKKSKVTTLDDRGFIKDQVEAPLTEEERAQEESDQAAEQKMLDEKNSIEEERQRVINVYESEEDIDRQRENQLNSVQSSIAVHEDYLKSMNVRVAHYDRQLAKARVKKSIEELNVQRASALQGIENSKKEIDMLEQQKKDISTKFYREKKIYREIMAEK